MSYSGDAAEQVVRMSLETGEVAVRLAGSGAKQLAILMSPPTTLSPLPMRIAAETVETAVAVAAVAAAVAASPSTPSMSRAAATARRPPTGPRPPRARPSPLPPTAWQ